MNEMNVDPVASARTIVRTYALRRLFEESASRPTRVRAREIPDRATERDVAILVGWVVAALAIIVWYAFAQ
jgi:hypothetical protein